MAFGEIKLKKHKTFTQEWLTAGNIFANFSCETKIILEFVWATQSAIQTGLLSSYLCDSFLGGTAFEVQKGCVAQIIVKATETGSGGLF